MSEQLPSFIKPSGFHLLDHLKHLKEGEAMLVVPHPPHEGKGYTITTVKAPK